MDQQTILRDFPALEELIYLNTASMGLVPRPVIAAAQAFEAELAGRGTTGFDEEAETRVLDTARAGAARLLGVAPESVAVTTSFTEALCQLAWALSPGAGSNVVSTDIDFPSVTYPWFRLAQHTGVEVRLVPVLHDPARLDVEHVAASVDARTAVICISHVQYLTGHRLDLSELAALAHAHDALLVVDATQSAGQVTIDAGATGVDVIIAGGYKFLCSTFGAAVCAMAPHVLARIDPPFVGWRSTVEPYDLDARYRSLAPDGRKLEYSTMSYAAAVALGAALDYVLALDVDVVHKHNQRLADHLRAGLAERGADLLTPADPASRAGTVTARFPGRDGETIARALTAHGVIVSPRMGSTRFSVHYYNTRDDVERALEVLDRVLAGAPRPGSA